MIQLLASVLLALALYTAVTRSWNASWPRAGLAAAGVVAVLLLPGDYPPQLAEGETLVVSQEDKHGLVIRRP